MAEVFGARMAMHFSPKDLGMNAGFSGFFPTVEGWISGLFSNSPEFKFRHCFRTVRTEFMDCFWVVLS